ncbi:hypothetical protein EDM68_01925 [Candidatus Uhrbacteria bacterium]|nr:MAG: hypothetical protein EDM68_01925 [Candidatus Uhrbacteria bacterium]
MAKTKSQRSLRRKKGNGTADFWAFLTITAFPLAILVTSAMGFSQLGSFVWGMLASLAVLFANSMAEGRLWMFDPKWKARFDQPDFSFRLAVTTGAILLLLESAVLVMLFTGNVERNLMSIVFERTCRNPDPHQIEFCRYLDRTFALRAR